MLSALQIVLVLLIMMLVGYGFSAKGYIDDKVAAFISKLVVTLGVPCAALDNMLSSFTGEMLKSAWLGLLVPFLIVLTGYALGRVLAGIFKVRPGRRGVFSVMIACSNTIFIGVPVTQAILGERFTSYALLYDVGHVLVFWTLGVYFMQKDGEVNSGREASAFFSWDTLKKLLSPGFIGLIAAILLLAFNVKVFPFALKTFKYLGSLCTPMALIYIGHVIQKTGLKNFRVTKDSLVVTVCRCLVGPALAFLFCYLFRTPGEMTASFMLEAAMPVMSSTPLVAAAYGSDSAFASEAANVTLLVSMALLPLLTLILETIL